MNILLKKATVEDDRSLNRLRFLTSYLDDGITLLAHNCHPGGRTARPPW